MTDLLTAIKERQTARADWAIEGEDGFAKCRYCSTIAGEVGWRHTWNCPANEAHLDGDLGALVERVETLEADLQAYRALVAELSVTLSGLAGIADSAAATAAKAARDRSNLEDDE